MFSVIGVVCLVAFIVLQALVLRRVQRRCDRRDAQLAESEASAVEYRRLLRIAEASAQVWRQTAENFEAAYERLFRERAQAPPPHSTLYSQPALHLDRPTRELYVELIEAGRRALARKYHPDAGGSEETMKALNALADRAAKT